MHKIDMNHNLDIVKSQIKQAITALSGIKGAYDGAIAVRIIPHLETAYQQATEIQDEDWNKYAKKLNNTR